MKRALFLAGLWAFVFLSACSHPLPRPQSNAPLRPDPTWAVSGFLPEYPEQRVWVVIEGKRIKEVALNAPSLPADHVLRTDDLIFPGFMDLSTRNELATLPPWGGAHSQFHNRFEVLYRSGYPDAVRMNREALRGEMHCPAWRWGGRKALAAGITSILDFGNSAGEGCGQHLGPASLENPQNFDGSAARALPFLLYPSLMGKVFDADLAPALRGGSSYDAAFQQMLEKEGVNEWLKNFRTLDHNLANGLWLAVGDSFHLDPLKVQELDFTAVGPALLQRLDSKPYRLNGAQAQDQLELIHDWLFGTPNSVGYLTSGRDAASAARLLNQPAVLTLPASLKRYVGFFEPFVRKVALEKLLRKDSRALFAPLASGRRSDPYSQREFGYLNSLQLDTNGVVIEGGSALSEKEFKEAYAHDLSLVWTPTADLRLFGETMDVAAAKAAGINLALGSVGGGVGSRNLQDELKLARLYLNKKAIKGITDQDLVNMVTVNAARALRMEDQLGQVKAGFVANLTLLHCPGDAGKGKAPYGCAVSAEAKDVDLVVVLGQARYGEEKFMEQLVTDHPLLRVPNSCGLRKMVRGREADLGKNLDEALVQAELPPADPVYSCEEKDFARKMTSFIQRLPASHPAPAKGWSPLQLSDEQEFAKP